MRYTEVEQRLIIRFHLETEEIADKQLDSDKAIVAKARAFELIKEYKREFPAKYKLSLEDFRVTSLN